MKAVRQRRFYSENATTPCSQFIVTYIVFLFPSYVLLDAFGQLQHYVANILFVGEAVSVYFPWLLAGTVEHPLRALTFATFQ